MTKSTYPPGDKQTRNVLQTGLPNKFLLIFSHFALDNSDKRNTIENKKNLNNFIAFM